MNASIKYYLQISGTLLFLIAFSYRGEAMDTTGSFYSSDIRLNPACKIKRMSNGEVFVTAKSFQGDVVTHKFKDFYADLLMAAYRQQRMDYIVTTFSKKYYLSQDDCRREIKHAVNVLAEWNIVVKKDQIALH
jgi:hypothetical protein